MVFVVEIRETAPGFPVSQFMIEGFQFFDHLVHQSSHDHYYVENDTKANGLQTLRFQDRDLDRRQLLFQLRHRSKNIAFALDPFEHVAGLKDSFETSSLLRAFSHSFHSTGAETVGLGRALREYAQTVVL